MEIRTLVLLGFFVAWVAVRQALLWKLFPYVLGDRYRPDNMDRVFAWAIAFPLTILLLLIATLVVRFIIHGL